MGKEENKNQPLDKIADALGLGRFETHLFICIGPDCCSDETGMASWNAVKKTLKKLDPDLPQARVYRTKVGCLRICKDGPIAVSYPQGKWFRGVTEDKVPELMEYLHQGSNGRHPLEFRRHPLPAPAEGQDSDGD